jgi:type I restriction-modification system DNA methylase subunit
MGFRSEPGNKFPGAALIGVKLSTVPQGFAIMSATTDIVQKLWNLCNVLRDDGVTYLQYVTDEGNTKAVWVYDLRSNMPQFGKRTQLTAEHFAEFEAAWATDAQGTSLADRVDTGEMGRFRQFTRKEVSDRQDSLDISWLRDENEERSEDLPEPEVLAAAAMTELKGAIEELQGILAELAAGEMR